MNRPIEQKIKSIDDLKNVLDKNPDFTLENLREAITELKSQKSFDDRLTIPILRKIISRYPELDMEDLKEMFLNPNFFDEEFEVKDNEETIEKYISLIEYWKYVHYVGIFVVESKKKK